MLQEPAVLVKTEIDEGNAGQQEMISGREDQLSQIESLQCGVLDMVTTQEFYSKYGISLNASLELTQGLKISKYSPCSFCVALVCTSLHHHRCHAEGRKSTLCSSVFEPLRWHQHRQHSELSAFFEKNADLLCWLVSD